MVNGALPQMVAKFFTRDASRRSAKQSTPFSEAECPNDRVSRVCSKFS
jgi:hypothetical protein